MSQPPAVESEVVYYWYYATQVLHNVPGPDWDNWNRKMRKLLITTQAKTGCAEGSWDPAEPSKTRSVRPGPHYDHEPFGTDA